MRGAGLPPLFTTAQGHTKLRVRGVKKRSERQIITVFAFEPKLADGLQKFQADAGALPFRHDDQTAGPGFHQTGPGRHGHMGHRGFADKADVGGGGDHGRQV